MFHGSDSQIDTDAANPSTGRFDLCLTGNPDVARQYGETVHRVELGPVDEAQPDEIDELIEEYAGERPRDYWERIEWLDCADFQRHLVEAGYTAARYPDTSPDNQCEHDCLRIFDADVVEGVEAID